MIKKKNLRNKFKGLNENLQFYGKFSTLGGLNSEEFKQLYFIIFIIFIQ